MTLDITTPVPFVDMSSAPLKNCKSVTRSFLKIFMRAAPT